MNMLPTALQQALAANGFQRLAGGAMKQHFGRHLGRKLQIDLDGMALIGANPHPVLAQGKTFLVVAAHHLLNQGGGELDRSLGNQRVYFGPAILIQRQADAFGLMAQDEAEVFTGGF